MNKRETTLTLAKIAGYHNDKAKFTRLYIEGRVNLGAMNAAFFAGVQARQNGVKCNCYTCQQEKLGLPAFRVTRSDGNSFVTSMAAGITLEQARKYFIGQQFTDEDSSGKETKWTATDVQPEPNPALDALTIA